MDYFTNSTDVDASGLDFLKRPVKLRAMLWAIIAVFVWFLGPFLLFSLFPSLDVWAHRHEDLVIGIWFAPMPLSILVGGLAVAFSRAAIGGLIIRDSSDLAAAVRQSFAILRRRWSFVLLPAVAATSVTVLLSFVLWQAFAPVSGMSRSHVIAYAYAIILRPQTIAVYLMSGIILMFSNAVLIRCQLDHAEGRAVDVGDATLSALRLVHWIAALAVVLFGGMLFMQFALRAFEGLLGRYKVHGSRSIMRLMHFLALLLECGALLGTNVLIAVMLAEDKGPAEAAEKALSLLQRKGKTTLRALFGMAAIKYETLTALFIAPWGAATLAGPYFVHDSVNQLLALWGVGFGLGIFAASVGFALINSLEAVLAVGLYERVSRGLVEPGFDKALFDELLGPDPKLDFLGRAIKT